MTEKHRVFLSLGSCLGNREEQLRSALRLIGEEIGTVERVSSFIETEPWGYESQHKFLNAAALCITGLSPRELLKATQRIEHQLGKRSRHSTLRNGKPQYHDRPIDIDILTYDDITIDEPDLKIPHPLMNERPFVMIPLNEILQNEPQNPNTL